MTRKWTAGTEASSIRYREPGFMEEEGWMLGVFGGCAFRNAGPEEASGRLYPWLDPDSLVRLEARLSRGKVDYDSRNTGSKPDNEDYMFEARASWGYEITRLAELPATPYFGLGYRYLNDDLRGRTTTGHIGYERESNYIYVPIGVDVRMQMSTDLVLRVNFEYDAFVYGEQKSHLEDVNPHCETLRNEQDGGYGLRGSVRLLQELQTVRVFVEPFYRYWKIDDSDVRPFTCNGATAGSGYEPGNRSSELGIRLGAQF